MTGQAIIIITFPSFSYNKKAKGKELGMAD